MSKIIAKDIHGKELELDTKNILDFTKLDECGYVTTVDGRRYEVSLEVVNDLIETFVIKK